MTQGQPLAGPEVAGYRIEAPLGRGGMGEVYRALDVRLGRQVALKVLADAVAGDARFRERFLRESQLAAGLDHPNVVPIYEAGDRDGRLFIAMRYVPGGDLKALLRRAGALDPAQAVAVATQLAGALDAAHGLELVHRDVKPSNVLLDGEHCYLADFGLSQGAGDRGPADGQFMGTIDYVSPEQVRGETLDGRADQYGLACLLFECLTGSVPFRRRSDVAAIFAHLEEQPPEASSRGAHLPRAIDPILARAMAKRREDRFESCTAFVSAAREGLGLVPAAPSRRRVVALAVAALAAIVALVVALLVRGGDTPAAPPPTGSLARIDPATNRVTARASVKGYPGQLAVTPGGIWMADFRGGVLWRYAPGAGTLERITSNGEPRDLAVDGQKVYVGADGRFLSGVVSRYDAATGVREDGIDLLACAMASGDGVVWAAGCPFAQRLSTGDGRLRKLAEVMLPYRSPATVENARAQFRELAVGGDSVWVLGDALDQRVWRLDAHNGRIRATIALGFPPTSVAVAGGRAWITDGVHDRVVPIDAATDRVLAPVSVGRGASGIAAGAGAVWVVNTLDGTLSRIDPATRRVAATIRVGRLPRGVAVGDGAVWVTAYGP
jgi:YVTN family beta-propeller protein